MKKPHTGRGKGKEKEKEKMKEKEVENERERMKEKESEREKKTGMNFFTSRQKQNPSTKIHFCRGNTQRSHRQIRKHRQDPKLTKD